MQQSQNSTPSWLKPNLFIDLKDKLGEWRVARILTITKTQIRVRYDGWSSKYDENFMIASPNIRGFRSVIRGYTGQMDSAPPREHYKFTELHHKQAYESVLTSFLQSMYTRSEPQITQFIRGQHYFWTDFLMTQTYTSKSQITLIFEYFFKHLELVIKYINDLLSCDSFQNWIDGVDGEGKGVEGRKAFAEAYWEVFDGVYAIMDGYPRLKVFFKSNASLISTFIEGYASYLQFMSDYINQVSLIALLQKLIIKLLNDKKSVIPLTFTTALTRLFSALQKTIKDKEKRKDLTQLICQLILRECIKMPDISVKEQQLELQKIYSTCKMFLLKYTWKSQFLKKFQLININSWKCMILSQRLQRKIKAINSLRSYFANLSNPHKKQVMMISNTKQQIQQQLRKQEILNAIFYENQHHEIIKKGCELVMELYKENAIGGEDLELVWKSCRQRVQAVRKIMYQFFEFICKDLKVNELDRLIGLISSDQLSQEVDRNFFYNILQRTMKFGTVGSIDQIQTLLKIAQHRLPQHRQQLKSFSQILTLPRSFQLKFVQKFANRIIANITSQSNNESIIFYLTVANHVFSDCGKAEIEFHDMTFDGVFSMLCATLKQKTKGHGEEEQWKREKVGQFLKLIQFLELRFDFKIQEFITLWQLFNEEQNHEIRCQQFLPWILHISHKGLFRRQHLQINRSLLIMAKQIFTQVLRKHSHFDYITLTELQFKIFMKFMIFTNIKEGNLSEHTNFLTGITYFRVVDHVDGVEGMKELFDIFLNCRNEEVVRKSAQLIKEMHLNYEVKSVQGQILRNKKVQQLLAKIQRYITDGIKKSNVRLIKNALYLLHDTALTVKQAHPMPQEYSLHHISLKSSKRTIKIKQDDRIIKQENVIMTSPIKSLKKIVTQFLKLPSHNLKLLKQTYHYINIDSSPAAIASNDDASASSAHSFSNTNSNTNSKNSPPHHTLIKNTVLEEIANEIIYGPISCLMLPENNSVIVVQEYQNQVYEMIERFTNQKISEFLLRILGEPEYFSKQSSELAYGILIEISCSNSTSLQLLNNLISQLKIKNKTTQSQDNSIGLSKQSINFKMYFCKNVNKLQIEEFKDFMSQSNYPIYEDIFREFEKQIVSGLQIELFLEIIDFVKKGLLHQKINTEMLNPQTILKCLLNLLEYNAGPKSHKEFKKQQRSHQNHNQIKVFLDCFNILQLLMKKNYNKLVNFIVLNTSYEKLMTLLFRVQGMKAQFGDLFENRMSKYLENIKKLDEKTQQIMYSTIFDMLYWSVIKIKNKKNTSFFKLIKDLISSANPYTISKLFTPNTDTSPYPQTPSFWQNCLKIIISESDSLHETDKQNKLLSGHLLILESLIKKNSKAVTEDLCHLLLFKCLFFHDQYTMENGIKCMSKNSIQAGLAVLAAIAKTDEKFLRQIVRELRIYQQTQYWRTPNFWNVNIQLQMKSPCGFVGLDNPGCICYLNSFTQTLFMNEQFRKQVINFTAVDQTKDYSLLHELRKLFLNLQHSNQKYLNPVPFTKTIKNTQDKSMIKISEQMDIEEYSSILFDKIEKLLPKDQDFVKEIFGGTYSNDIISKECKHCSQREESFLSMQLDVKPNLQESLKTLVKGEILQGQNAYYCQKCNKKVRALKRMSIKKLPNYLIICLKRFEYNFQTDQKFKVNSSCQFPLQLTLQPYSQQSLSSEQQLQQFNTNLNPNTKEQQAQTEQIERLPHQYFQYKLKGIIIHTGSSESGHYYAIIESGKEPERWFQFNDSVVSDFDIEGLGDQAFGSDDPASTKSKNAYMLVYERRKKINLNPKPQPIEFKNQNSSSLSSTLQDPHQPECQKILSQIKSRNKQIQTFHTMFTKEYHNFISEIINTTINSNLQLIQQYKKKLIEINPNFQTDINNNNNNNKQENNNEMIALTITTKQLSQDTVIQVIKCYLEYCFFVRAREINLQVLIEYLRDLQCLISVEMLHSVADYFLHQLSQTLFLEQLFIEVSFRDKLVVLANFTTQVVLTRLKNSNKGQQEYVIVLVLRIVEAYMTIMVRNGVCVGELLHLMRRLVEEYPYFIDFFEKIDTFNNIFEIVAGLKQSAQDREHKVIRLRQQSHFLIKQNFKHVKTPFQSSTIPHQQHQMIQQHSQQQQQEQYPDYEHQNTYQIASVKRYGKCLLKVESPQQAWNYLYLVYRFQSQVLRKLEEMDEGEEQGQGDVEGSDGNADLYVANNTNIDHKRLFIKRDLFEAQFSKMKNECIESFLHQCQGSKPASSLALFLCQLAHENPKTTDRLLQLVAKNLQKLQATKFRPCLLLLYYLALHSDTLTPSRHQTILSLLQGILAKNAKYFSETDILHQWIIKVTYASPGFADLMVRTEEGVDLFNEIMERLDLLRMPTQEMIKKQKNSTYQRLNYQIHGLIVSIDLKVYEKLQWAKKQFFGKLFHQESIPLEVQTQLKSLTLAEPDYQQLVARPKPGQVIYYLFNRKWLKVLVKSTIYGLIKVCELVRKAEAPKPLHEQPPNTIVIQGKTIDLGNDIIGDQFTIWESEERLKQLLYYKTVQEGQPLQATSNNKKQGKTEQKGSQGHDMEPQEQDNSSLSYQSSSGHI